MKGVSVPISVILVVVLAVIVIAIFLAFFTSQSTSLAGGVNLEKQFNLGCTKLIQNECDHTALSDVRLSGNTLENICVQKGITDSAACARLCGCSIGVDEQGILLSSQPVSEEFISEGRPQILIFTTEV